MNLAVAPLPEMNNLLGEMDTWLVTSKFTQIHLDKNHIILRYIVYQKSTNFYGYIHFYFLKIPIPLYKRIDYKINILHKIFILCHFIIKDVREKVVGFILDLYMKRQFHKFRLMPNISQVVYLI